MYRVITKVKLSPNSLDTFQELFEQRIPAVLGQCSAWRGAEMSIEPEENNVVVVGSWADAGEMQEFMASPQHQELIEELSRHFAGAPEVTITEAVARVGHVS